VTPWGLALMTAIVTVTASSGFWTYMLRKDTTRTQTNHLLMGLAYKEIIALGMSYIERGWITQDEYEDYRRYLYEPYKKLGGNGVTERVMAEVSNLRLMSRHVYGQLLQEVKARGQDGNQFAENHPQ